MALNIKDPEPDELAMQKGLAKTQRVEPSLWERLQPLLDEIRRWPDTGVIIDKAFYDDPSGEDERCCF